MISWLLFVVGVTCATMSMVEAAVMSGDPLVNMKTIKCLFSDIDGTLVHYYDDDDVAPGPPEVIALPASSSGRKGRVSFETLRLIARLRSVGVRVVLVSGTRYATFVQRLPSLPRADAYVIENGGRIFLPKTAEENGGDVSDHPTDIADQCETQSAVDNPSLTSHPEHLLMEDLRWRRRLEPVSGPASQDVKPPEEREGPLWDLYRRVVAMGFEVDTRTYYTMLRIKLKNKDEGETNDEDQNKALQQILDLIPEGMHVVTNLGMVDVCPEASGKDKAAEYLAADHFDIPLDRCSSMGDDDNDIALAKMMGQGAFITTYSSESMRKAAAEHTKQFHVATRSGVEASEELLRLILERS